MGVENLAEDSGRRRPGSGGQGRVEAGRENGRAHVDLARGGLKREITLESQVLKRHGYRADDRERDADRSGGGKPASDSGRTRPTPEAAPSPGGKRSRRLAGPVRLDNRPRLPRSHASS